ncbi:MAG: hypothetical protein J7J36_06505 [Thermoplasmata archaeon]|nr:hypothetical protein [Thermoplasmata archaeon]
MLKRIVHILSSIKLGFYLLVCIALTLAIGSYYATLYPELFKELNNHLFLEWFKFYGQKNPDKIWWLFVLFLLLAGLGINTLICALKKLSFFWRRRKQLTFEELTYKIIPSIVHLCFFLGLVGHFLSITVGINQTFQVKLGRYINLADGVKGKILEQNCVYYKINLQQTKIKRLLKQCRVFLKIANSGELVKISFLHPVSWHGLSFYLDKVKTDDGSVSLNVKNDPGAKLTLISDAMMAILMAGYFLYSSRKEKKDEKDHFYRTIN